MPELTQLYRASGWEVVADDVGDAVIVYIYGDGPVPSHVLDLDGHKYPSIERAQQATRRILGLVGVTETLESGRTEMSDANKEQTTMAHPKTQKQTYRLWTYDLWADGEGGLMVNDRFDQGLITILVKAKVYNPGTEHEFLSYNPTARQLNRAVGARGLTWEGESEYTLYAEDKYGNPACELERVKE